MNIKKFKELKNELKKEWSAEDFSDTATKQLYYLIKHNFYKNLNFTAGSRPRYGYIEHFTPSDEISDIFGFTYTSSSGFRALWNTNTQAEAKTKQFYLKFRAVSKDIQNNFIFIFEDKKEEFYYFNANNFEFSTLMNEAQKIDESETAENFTKEANQILKYTMEVLRKYEGKAYGEATRKKIHDEIKEKTNGLQIADTFGRGASFWINSDKYGQGLEVSNGAKYKEHYYFKFLNDSNKIEITEEPKPKKEYNGAELHAQAEKLRQKITEIAGELLPLVNEFNDIKRALYTETKDTDTHAFQLYSVAKYGIKD